MTYERGNVIAVDIVSLGSSVAADTAAGVTVLSLSDASDFPEDGGQVVIDSTIYLFDSTDLDADTLTLSTPLLAAMEEGDPVLLWDPTVEDVSKEWVAHVVLDEALDGEDPVEALVPHALTPLLGEGIRDTVGESVSLELDGEEWRVVDVYGTVPTIDGRTVWNPHMTLSMNGIAAVPHNVWTQVTSWTVREADGITTGSTFTIIWPGPYFANAQAAFAGNPNGRRAVRILVNGVVMATFSQTADTSTQYVTALMQERLAEGDVVSVEVLQTSGAGLELFAGPLSSKFTMHRVSI